MMEKANDRKSLGMLITSMLIFGTIGVLRRHIPLPSAFLAFVRGILGGLFLLIFAKVRKKDIGAKLIPPAAARKRKAARGESRGGDFSDAINEAGPLCGTDSSLKDLLSSKSFKLIPPAAARKRKAARGESRGGDFSDAINEAGPLRHRLEFKKSTQVFLRLAVTGALIGVNWILLFEAYNHTTVAVATLCYYMEPTIVVLLSPVIFKERLTGKRAVCAAVSIVGMVLVSGVIGDSGGQSSNIRGILLGLGAAAFYSAVVIMNKKTPGIDAYRRTIIQLFSAGIVMLPYLFLTNGFGSSEGFSATAMILLLILGIVHTGIAYALYFGSMDGLRVQTIAVFSYIDPVSALVFSVLFLREPFNLLSIVGAIMIIGSAMISEI